MTNKTDYFMGFAEHAASASKDPTKVGAALIGPDGTLRATGYNGPPRGVRDLPERFQRPAKYLFASHAEANLIAFCARDGITTDACTVYVTHMCCAACARTLIQAGIARVVYGPGETSMPPEEFEAARVMFKEAGLVVFPAGHPLALPASGPAGAGRSAAAQTRGARRTLEPESPASPASSP